MFSRPLIIVATDFSAFSDLALKAGEILRQKTNGNLLVVHASPYPYEWNWLTNDILLNPLPDEYKNGVIKSLNLELENQVKRCEVQCEHKVLFGNIYKALQDEITTKKADLLIMGHRGASAQQFFLGSLVAKMIATSEIPVLVINTAFSIKKIAGLVDTEDPMKNIIPTAEELSFLFSTELEFISVWQDISAQFLRRTPVPTSSHFTYGMLEQKKIIATMESMIQEEMDPHSKAKINVEITNEKSISDALIRKLDEESIELAVVTRHRRKILEKMFIGSVTRRLLDLYKGNLLILPPPGLRS